MDDANDERQRVVSALDYQVEAFRKEISGTVVPLATAFGVLVWKLSDSIDNESNWKSIGRFSVPFATWTLIALFSYDFMLNGWKPSKPSPHHVPHFQHLFLMWSWPAGAVAFNAKQSGQLIAAALWGIISAFLLAGGLFYQRLQHDSSPPLPRWLARTLAGLFLLPVAIVAFTSWPRIPGGAQDAKTAILVVLTTLLFAPLVFFVSAWGTLLRVVAVRQQLALRVISLQEAVTLLRELPGTGDTFGRIMLAHTTGAHDNP